MPAIKIEQWFQNKQSVVSAVVPFDKKIDHLLALDFNSLNLDLIAEVIEDTDRFSAYIVGKIKTKNAKYGIGGYDEHRTVYQRSKVFDGSNTDEEPRRLHLGIDIWGEAGTPVFAVLNGVVHSFAFNDRYGDYGATIILQHTLDGFSFHSLYGHLSLKDLTGLQEGKSVLAGEEIAHFGEPIENGHWPPHLHLQLIIDMEGMKGDYPGVCRFSEREKYLANCPNPDLLLNMMECTSSSL
ncbi:MAG: peptidoglycan DD-metalloendopeptidase family protein [Sediminibacterium sp.]